MRLRFFNKSVLMIMAKYTYAILIGRNLPPNCRNQITVGQQVAAPDRSAVLLLYKEF